MKAPYPPSLKEMYGLTCAPECGLLDFHTEVNFGEEPVHDSEGTPIETTEQWLRIGISGNDRIFVGMHTGTIALYDPDFYRYGETSGLRLIAPDMLSFFEKCLHAHSYATILQLDSEDEDEWHSFLIENPA